jgi:hypothetical protein
MMESSVIQERRRILQQQQVITLPAVTENMQQLDHLYDSDESVHADILDMGENYEDSVSGLSFALEGAKDFSMSPSLSGSTVVGDHLCLATPSDPKTHKAIFSDHSVVVQTKPQSRGTTSKLRVKLRDIMEEHRRLQSMTTPHEPPALFQGLIECL